MGAPGSDPGLNIPIRTTADNTGSIDAAKGVEHLGAAVVQTADAMAKGFAASNAKAAEFGDTLTHLTNDQLLDLEAKVRDDIKSFTALGQNTDDLKQKLAALYSQRTGEPLQQIGDSARYSARGLSDQGEAAHTSAEQLTELRKSGREASEVFRGLGEASEGGARGILGTIGALRGIVGLFKSIGSTLAGPVGIGLGIAAAGIAALGRLAEKNQLVIEAMFTAREKQNEALKTSNTNLEEAAKKSLDAQLAAVDRLAKGYQALIAAMDAAAHHAAAVNEATNKRDLAKIDRDEQAALGKAKTPEAAALISTNAANARREITDRAAVNDIVNTADEAKLRKDNAQDAIDQQRSLIEAAETDARRKKTAADDAISISDQVVREQGPGSTRARSTIADAQAAKKASDLADENLKKIREEGTKVIDAATKEIETANNTAELVKIQRQALLLAQQAAGQKDANTAAPAIKKLTATAQSAMEAGDFAGQDQAVKQIKTLTAAQASRTAELKQSGSTLASALDDHALAQKARDTVVIKAINGQAVQADQTARQLKNSR